MKIAINCGFYQPRGGGISEYIYNLVTNLISFDTKHEFLLYVFEDQLDYAKSAFKNVRIKTIPFKSNNPVRRSLFEQRFWTTEERIERFDIFHSPFFHSPEFLHAKVILTVHDLRFCVYPSTYTMKRWIYLKYAVRKSVKKAYHIITISEFTKQELMRFYKIPDTKITVIHEAINVSDFSIDKIAGSELNQDVVDLLSNKTFIFSLGHVEPRKNYVRLVKAFRKVLINYPDAYLVIAGKKAQGIKALLNEMSGVDHVIYLDFVSRPMLLWLYSHARAFVFPSIYEGFGFPPLEAAAFGTPSIVANSSCIPEICGKAAIYFDPYDINDIQKACEIIISDDFEHDRLRINATENLNRFSWIKNAEETMNTYNMLAL